MLLKKNSMRNVLVFPCGSEIGLEIHQALSYSTHFTLFGANSIDDHGKFIYKNYIGGLPYLDSPNFINVLNKIIEKNAIDYILPAHDSAVLKLASNQRKIKAVIVTSCQRTCEVCRSKALTYKIFKSLIPTPQVYDIEDVKKFPIFLKPDIGQGTKGTYIANSVEEIKFYFKKDPTLIALEYLPGNEFTIDCFTDKSGKLLFSEGRQRIRINNGISVNSKPIIDPRFRQIADVINQTLSFQGVWFYQVKERSNHELVLMEISTRPAGTAGLFRALGVNLVLLSLFDKMGIEVSIIKNNLDIEIDRALISRFSFKESYTVVYIDLDDTIVFSNKVNTNIIKFLYQSRNMCKKIILLSKHKENIRNTLSRFAISDLLFDEIVLIEPHQKKVDYITALDSIFIDDSFIERKDVFDKLKIPVFSVDAVESLIFWKE